jgi:hypothetical protein
MFSCWLDSFGAQDMQRLTASRAALQPEAAESIATRSVRPSEADGGDSASVAHQRDGGSTHTARSRGLRQAPIKLSGAAEKLAPFHSPLGNRMMAARRAQQGSAKALGDKVGFIDSMLALIG